MVLERIIRYGPIVLTLVYIIVVIFLGLLLPSCPTDENGSKEGGDCGSEGHDNFLLSWSTDFFVAGAFAVMGVLLYLKTSQKRFVRISYASLFVAYILKGMVSRYFGNSGMDDGKGAAGYYGATFVSYIFWTLSALFLAFIIQAAWGEIGEDGLHCGRAESLVALILMVIATLFIVTGSLWALAFSVNDVTDEYSESEATPASIPLTMLLAAQLLWHAFYSTFLVSTAYILRALAKQRAIMVGGVPNSFPATGIVLAQVVIVGIFLFYALDAVSNEVQWGASDSHTMATVAFNYAMLMTVYFVTSFLVALFPTNLSRNPEKDISDTDSDETPNCEDHADDYDEENKRGENDQEANQDEWAIDYKDTENNTMFMGGEQGAKDNFDDEDTQGKGTAIKSKGSLLGMADEFLREWNSFSSVTPQRVSGADKKATNKSIESSLVDIVGSC
jgi:hypothetical protein